MLKINRRTIGTALVLFVLLPSKSTLSEVKRSKDFAFRQKRIIKSLFINKRYFDCIAETRRLLSYLPAIPYRDEYKYFIEANYFLGGQYKTVISHIKGVKEKDRLHLPYLLLLSRSYFELGLNNETYNSLFRYDYGIMKKREGEELFLRRIELYLTNSMYREALLETSRFKRFNSDIRSTEEMENDIKGYAEIGLKSKELSLLLSAAIPGSGQIYSGRIADGLITLAAIIASSYGAYYFHRKGRSDVSFTLMFFSTLFYAGNIYGAYNSTEEINRRLNEQFKRRLIEKYIPPYKPMSYINSEKILE